MMAKEAQNIGLLNGLYKYPIVNIRNISFTLA